MSQVRRSLLGSLISLLAFAVLAIGAVSASAYEDPTWWDEKAQLEKETIMDFFYKMGPQGVTPYPGEPATLAAETYAALPTGFSDDPSESDLTR